MKTLARCIALPFALLLVWAPAAQAWSWPLPGPVLQPFVYDQAHPYTSGQHRGIDIGAEAVGDTVVAPADGTIGFAGTVPTSGKSVTIETPDGYSVTLTHLGSILVAEGETVAEGNAVGTVGPSGTPEVDGPYIHLGIRLAADPNGYVDPLGLLPVPAADGPPADSGSPVPQPSASGGSAGTPSVTEPEPAPESGPVATTRGSTVSPGQSRVAQHQREKPQEPPAETSQRPPSHSATRGQRVQHRDRPSHSHPLEPTSTVLRPVVKVPSAEPTRVETPFDVPAPPARPTAPRASLVPLLCNGAAALVAAAAALAAARRRRGLIGADPIADAEILHLPRPTLDRRERHAA